MRRGVTVLLLVVLTAAGAGSAAAQEIRTEDVRYQNGSLTLAALLMLPAGGETVPAAVIAQGSGRSDRSNGWARLIAEELVERGLAVLLTDKRGSGASDGDWQTASFEDLAGDAIAGVEYLRGRADIDGSRVGVVGLSQGGQVAPLAAAASDDVAFVISVSSKTVTFAEGAFLEMANTARQAGLTGADVETVVQVNVAAMRYLTTGNWEQYEDTRNQALETGARDVAAGFPSSPDLAIWTFLRSVATYDPLTSWVQVSQPTLVVYGEEDERDNVPVRESVRRLEHAFRTVNKSDYRILVAPGVGHSIAAYERARPRLQGDPDGVAARARATLTPATGGSFASSRIP